ncbi:MAG: hydrogenase [Candidatus Odinarchaeum yellowstonii]|jgi:sulfhydrogenase subunit delta|uniref:Hydrogenase n=1 Tax=Odinarchaeota yellowstonii (strain LCB_4) TaxID=1841599 RepID=A0AAF0D386_ODILC|nr:MAG: hydrogenase [Candidatus Odinarchaeum yellowstonii]
MTWIIKNEKPKIGVFSLTGCAGDQLMILNLEDTLIELLAKFDIKSFQEASSYSENTKLDIAFIEGSVSTDHDLKILKNIRENSSLLVAIGDCAINGCVQAMRNNQTSIAERMLDVYGVKDNVYNALEPKGVGEYVKVDAEIPGCPIEKEEVFNAFISLLNGDMPLIPDYPVCVECKLNGYPCVIIEESKPCLGPIITAGCDARCPGLGLDCIGCRGAIRGETNAKAELETLRKRGYNDKYIINRLRFFAGNFEDIKNLGVREASKGERDE